MDQTMQFEVLHPGVQAAVKEDGQSSFPVCPADRSGASRRGIFPVKVDCWKDLYYNIGPGLPGEKRIGE